MLRIDNDNAIRILTLDRPEKSNSLHPELISSLIEALDRANQDPAVRVVIITGAGKSFCGGMDLIHLTGLDVDGTVEYMGSALALFRRVYELRQPVIAAVNGPAMAGGFDLAAFCDIRICSDSARFAQTEILLGLTQIMYPLYKVIGLGRAKELALTGKAIPADEAFRIGLVTGVYSEADLLPAVLKLAAELASRPPEALFATKQLSRELIDMDTESAITRMSDAGIARLRSDEFRAAVNAYAASLRDGR
jgi:enoyl-CoA hydratase